MKGLFLFTFASAFLCLAPMLHGSDWPPAGKPVKIPVSRDTWVSIVGKEADHNLGGSTKLKTKGIQEFSVLDLSPEQLKGKVVTGATLHFKHHSGPSNRRVSISTVATDWVEGTSTDYATQPGSASFKWAEQGKKQWAHPGSDMSDVINGIGNTYWRFADVQPEQQNAWQMVAVDPLVVKARIAGISYGFALMDDVGNEYKRVGNTIEWKVFLNRFICSRESGAKSAPYFTIYVDGEDALPPGKVDFVQATTRRVLKPGEGVVSWTTPADQGKACTVGFEVRVSDGAFDWQKAKPVARYLIPMAGKTGEAVTMYLRDGNWKPGTTLTVGVRAVDGAGNIGEVVTGTVKLEAPVAPLSLPENSWKVFTAGTRPKAGPVEVSVIDLLDKVNPVTGVCIPKQPSGYFASNHLFSGKAVRLAAAKNEFVACQLLLSGKSDKLSVRTTFPADSGVKTEILRFHHVQTKSQGRLPDPLVPHSGSFSLPSKDYPEQKHQSLIIDIYIPHDARAGDIKGSLEITAGEEKLSLPIQLHVWNFTLPDYLSFVPQMNCYRLPANEMSYYRMAHKHRTCLNRLTYGWSGNPHRGCHPVWDGNGFDWSDFDARYGALLDGSAFNDLPRKGVPVDSMYLPLNENWPFKVDENIKKLGFWIEDVMKESYRKDFMRACALVAEHCSQKKWHESFIEFYLNNKVYYKAKGKRGWDTTAALWILDEPVNTQDFWTLRWYGVLFHEAIAEKRGEVKLAYRCDISRSQWQRNLMDGILDMNIVGGPGFRQYLRRNTDLKEDYGVVTYNYGSSNPVAGSNLQPLLWCMNIWSKGGDGVLPWQTIGKETSWDKDDQLSLFYPGSRVQQDEPVVSVRLKSYRRGQQDIEYLTLLYQNRNKPRWIAQNLVKMVVNPSMRVKMTHSDDAGTAEFGSVQPQKLWDFRMRIAAQLDRLAPAAKRKLVDFAPHKRDVKRLPDVGYARVAPPRK